MQPTDFERAVSVLTERLEKLETELRDARWQKVADALAGLEGRTGELIKQLDAKIVQVHERVRALEASDGR